MEVLLLQDVKNVGKKGAIVSVSDGMARNMLLPRKLAVQATTGAKKNQAQLDEQRKVQEQKQHEADLALVKSIEALSPVQVKAKVGDDGKLFGTITPKDLATLLSEKTGQTVDKRNLHLPTALNKIGAYDVELKVAAGILAKLVVDIRSDA